MQHLDTPESSVNQGRNSAGLYDGMPGSENQVAMAIDQARWRKVGEDVRYWISVRRFSMRELDVLEVIWRGSFLREVSRDDSLDAFIPRDLFASSADMGWNHLPDILGRLIDEKNVIERTGAEFYGFVLPAEGHWRVPLRGGVAAAWRQLELLERPPSIRTAARKVFLEQYGVTPDGANARQGIGRQVNEEQSGVPESGTPDVAKASYGRVVHSKVFPNRERRLTEVVFPNREGAENGREIRGAEVVPESGTAPLVITSVSTDPKQYCLREKSSRGKRFNAVEQARWNRLIELCCANGKEAFRNERDRNFFIAFLRNNGGEFEKLSNALAERMKPEQVRMNGPVISGAAWWRDEWERWGRPGDWH
jgi:hypothetical protein